MERRFSVEFVFDKQLYHEFGYLYMKRRKFWAVFLWLTIATMVACVVNTAGGEYGVTVLLVIAVFYYFYWLFADRLVGWGTRRNMNKRTEALPRRLTFTEESIFSEYSEGSSTTFYGAIMDVMEGDDLFALYLSRASAIPVPKNAFREGSVDDFRAFITEKVGPVRRVKSSKRRLVLGILLGVAFVASMVGAAFLRDYLDTKLARYGDAPYSIQLPGEFEQYADEDYYFSAWCDGVYVYAFSETQEVLQSYGAYGLDTPMDYAENFAVIYGIEEPNYQTLGNSTVCMSYTENFDGETIYYCDAVVLSGDTFWLTEFYCLEEQSAEYAPQFLTWAATIRIDD